nr:hypothetical protein B0A51_02711 [Rachicladosporium sp. CCFEE 5018]
MFIGFTSPPMSSLCVVIRAMMEDLTKRMSRLLQQPNLPKKQPLPYDSTAASFKPTHSKKPWTKQLSDAQDGPKLPTRSKPTTRSNTRNGKGMTRKDPRLPLIPRPPRMTGYNVKASMSAKHIGRPVPLLIVLDLNGTLLSRHPKNRQHVKLRPHLDKFLEYLFNRHKVVIWSSATPESVTAMLSKIFFPEGDAVKSRANNDDLMEWYNRIVAMWNRKHLDLGDLYWQNPQVYKQLSRLWADPNIQSTCFGGQWDQFNTLLIDDSLEKAASEPHNLVQIREMVWNEDDQGVEVLAQVAKYISKASNYQNVSAFVKENPFKHDPVPRDENTWAWMEQNMSDFMMHDDLDLDRRHLKQ